MTPTNAGLGMVAIGMALLWFREWCHRLDVADSLTREKQRHDDTRRAYYNLLSGIGTVRVIAANASDAATALLADVIRSGDN